MLSVCTQFSEVEVHVLVELLGESTDVLKEEEGVGRGLAGVGVEQENGFPVVSF